MRLRHTPIRGTPRGLTPSRACGTLSYETALGASRLPAPAAHGVSPNRLRSVIRVRVIDDNHDEKSALHDGGRGDLEYFRLTLV